MCYDTDFPWRMRKLSMLMYKTTYYKKSNLQLQTRKFSKAKCILTRLRKLSLSCVPSPCCTRVVTTGAVVPFSSACRPPAVVHRIGGNKRVGRTFGGVDDRLGGCLAFAPFFRRHATPPLSDLFTLDGRHCKQKQIINN